MELWDAYYRNGSPAGVLLRRGEPVPQGLYHIVPEILVRHTDGTYLLMQWHPEKDLFPSCWETTAGGSALRGEDAYTAALRELWEETGIRAETLQSLSSAVSADTLYYEYLCVTHQAKDSVRMQEGETVAYRWVSPQELKAFLSGDACIAPQRERFAPYFHSQNQIGRAHV